MNDMPPAFDGAALLARTAELGEYFAIPAGDAGGETLTTMLSGDEVVRDFVDRTRTAIAASRNCDRSLVPVRMAASAFQLNVAARLISPAIGAAVALGVVPMLTPASVRWTATTHHSPQFGATDLDWVSAPTPSRAAELISASVLATVIGPLNEKLRSTLALSPHVSWGNAISAANGAVTVMSMSRPDLEGSGRELVQALLETAPLVDTGSLTGGRFVRRSCCLFYQAPRSGYCQDCVLTALMS